MHDKLQFFFNLYIICDRFSSGAKQDRFSFVLKVRGNSKWWSSAPTFGVLLWLQCWIWNLFRRLSLICFRYILALISNFPGHLLLKRRTGFREIKSNHPKVSDSDSVGKVCCGLLVRRKVVGDPSEVTPLPAPLVFVANLLGLVSKKSREGQTKCRKLPKLAGTKCRRLTEIRMLLCWRCPGFGLQQVEN